MKVQNGFRLRHVVEADLDVLLSYRNDPEIQGVYLPSHIVSPVEFRRRFNENGFSSESHEQLLIVDEDDAIVGTVWHFKSVPYFNAREIGYTLYDMSQRGDGIVSNAVKAVTNYLFNSFTINRLEIRMDTRNLGSEKVAIKCGFTKEGTSRGANFVYGENVDMHIYALLRYEWVNAQAS